ncbi:MAG: hypothetical protein AAB367_02605 [Patescibacteria group bacterium]
MLKIILIGVFAGSAVDAADSNFIAGIYTMAAVIIFCFYLEDLAKIIAKR